MQVVINSPKNLSDFFAESPSPDEILALCLSAQMQEKIDELLQKNRREGLNEAEEKVWADYESIEHLVRIAKTSALKIKEEKFED